ncbi:hypothetical protein [Weizmannia acidilactici]|uniref:hypothetical protein n=1 Tax=Weizmannia acidilactici TaxID=2607726 RepID=UPI00124C1FA8|nr:hypothetical protein [Weizmannia acidilactici]GER67743.1 hypothetical protein BpJC4_22140 [Weizmannia acidilactici]GER73621.1 hypothetical protein BpPP18_16880 [Weizmannia acidilactici]
MIDVHANKNWVHFPCEARKIVVNKGGYEKVFYTGPCNCVCCLPKPERGAAERHIDSKSIYNYITKHKGIIGVYYYNIETGDKVETKNLQETQRRLLTTAEEV